jgi:hypothetical protein
MAFDGTEGGAITLMQASAMTAQYRTSNPGATKAHFFGREAILNLLGQSGCMGIRIYYGINPTTGAKELILVGADAAGNDMTNVVMDMSAPCPKYCSSTNALNTSI